MIGVVGDWFVDFIDRGFTLNVDHCEDWAL